MSDFCSVSFVKKSRKRHPCERCNEWIDAGSSCVVFSGHWDGYMFRCYQHDECHEASARCKDFLPEEPFEPGECMRGKTYAETNEIRSRIRDEEAAS